MTATAMALVLLAALLHSGWNALIKGTDERLIVLGLISAVNVAVGFVLVCLVPLPASASWPYIAASTIVHFAYYAFLLLSYRLGDLSQMYPVARGIAPVLVALGAYFFAGEQLPPTAWAGILIISFGISLLAWGIEWSGAGGKALTAALVTGLMIASYSVIDGIGVRLAGNALGYIGWLFLFEGYVALFLFYRERAKLRHLDPATIQIGFLGGLLSAGAYGLVIFAKTLAPIASVSAVRESSVIITALLGIVLLGERPWKLRVVAALLVVCGVVVLTVFT